MISVRRLTWDPRNVAHIAAHQVSPEEVEQVCHGSPVALGSYDERLILIGPTRAGRMLATVLEPEGGGIYYPVTARPASRKERRYYQAQKEERQT
jgi:uncharacterized protein